MNHDPSTHGENSIFTHTLYVMWMQYERESSDNSDIVKCHNIKEELAESYN